MFDSFVYLALPLVGGIVLLAGIILFVYGLYSLTVKGFDRTVQNYSLFIGSGTITAVVLSFLYFYQPRKQVDMPQTNFPYIENNASFNTTCQYESPTDTSSQFYPFLKNLSKMVLETSPYPNEEQARNQWIGICPATAYDLKSAERKIDQNLPEDYKAFLLLSNGLYFDFDNLVYWNSTLQIGRFRDHHTDIIQAWRETGQTLVADKLELSIMIGFDEMKRYFLLIPPVDKQSNWEYWTFSTWDPVERVYTSMEEMLEAEMEQMKRIHARLKKRPLI